MESKPVYHHKIILLGGLAVGKTSLLTFYLEKAASTNAKPTLGAQFVTKELDMGSHIIKFEIWDTTGQERFRSLTKHYYRGSSAAIVMYDITDESTVSPAMEHVKELLAECVSPRPYICLVANKCDLEEHREVPKERGEKLADENDAIYFETSAMTGLNVEEVFQNIAEHMIEYEERERGDVDLDAPDEEDDDKPENRKKHKC